MDASAEITFHAESRMFHLSNGKLSYILHILENGQPGHLYFGKAVRDRPDFTHLQEKRQRAMAANPFPDDDTFSLEHLRQEYPSYGSSDFRQPAVEILQADGSRITEFRYESHKILDGKPPVDGLPATYTESDGEAATLAQQAIDEAGSPLGDYQDIFAQGFSSPETLFAPYVEYPLEMLGSNVTSDVMSGYGTTVALIANELAGTVGDEQYDARYTDVFTPGSLKKYVLNSTATGDENTYYLMRLAELYLIKAEAEARRGNYAPARTALKAITDRAGYDADYVDGIADADLLLAIFRHKYMELAAENYEEWFDMVRYYVLDGTDFTATGLGYTVSMQHLTLPIPEKARSGNNLLKQNPSYELTANE